MKRTLLTKRATSNGASNSKLEFYTETVDAMYVKNHVFDLNMETCQEPGTQIIGSKVLTINYYKVPANVYGIYR